MRIFLAALPLFAALFASGCETSTSPSGAGASKGQGQNGAASGQNPFGGASSGPLSLNPDSGDASDDVGAGSIGGEGPRRTTPAALPEEGAGPSFSPRGPGSPPQPGRGPNNSHGPGGKRPGGKGLPVMQKKPEVMQAMDRAWKLIKGGDLDGAVTELDHALKLAPNDPDVMLANADVLLNGTTIKLQAGEDKLAEQWMQRAEAHLLRFAKQFPNSPEPTMAMLQSGLFLVGRFYSKHYGDHEKAIQTLSLAVELGLAELEMLDRDEFLEETRKDPAWQEFRDGAPARFVDGMFKRAKPTTLDFSLADPDGANVKLSSLAPDVVVLDFFISTQSVCRNQSKRVNELFVKHKGEGLRPLGIAMEGQQSAQKSKLASVLIQAQASVRRYRSTNKLDYPLLLCDADTDKAVPNLEILPTIIFIDRAGQIRGRHDGPLGRPIIEIAIQRLLAETPAEALENAPKLLDPASLNPPALDSTGPKSPADGGGASKPDAAEPQDGPSAPDETPPAASPEKDGR